MMSLEPYSDEELMQAFHDTCSICKHLLILHSFAVGLQAQVIIDLGIGSTTRALRAAALKTGGVVKSCDSDSKRFAPLLAQQDEQWRLFLGASEIFLRQVSYPFDFVLHDAAHDYFQVKLDLELILPRMRKFGLICVHDTQQPVLGRAMLAAIRDATRKYAVSVTQIPFAAGLAVIRVEESDHPAVSPAGNMMPDGQFSTSLLPSSLIARPNKQLSYRGQRSLKHWLRWRARKVVRGW